MGGCLVLGFFPVNFINLVFKTHIYSVKMWLYSDWGCGSCKLQIIESSMLMVGSLSFSFAH